MADKTVEDLAALLLERGFDPKMLSSAKLRDIASFQKILIDKRKLSLQESAMDKAFRVLMSGTIGLSPEIMEGEIVPELEEEMKKEIKIAAKPHAHSTPRLESSV